MKGAAEIGAVLIAGPTASGKSALALALAESLRGTIINAGSTQVYRDLRIITAHPPPGRRGRPPLVRFAAPSMCGLAIRPDAGASRRARRCGRPKAQAACRSS